MTRPTVRPGIPKTLPVKPDDTRRLERALKGVREALEVPVEAPAEEPRP